MLNLQFVTIAVETTNQSIPLLRNFHEIKFIQYLQLNLTEL